MTDGSLEQRVDILEQEVHAIHGHLDTLVKQLQTTQPPQRSNNNKKETASTPVISSDQLWSWVGKSSILPRIATICFIMVFALILRTLTDNNIIGLQLGSFVGIGYAAILVGWGAKLLAQQSRLATVFLVCGLLLMYSVTLESYVRFVSISAQSVYLILFILLLVTCFVGIRFKHASLNAVSIFSACLVASVIDFPTPCFVSLIYLLLVGNVLAFMSAKKLGRGEFSRLAIFLLTISVWVLWTCRLQVALSKGLENSLYLSAPWFFPSIFLFMAIFMAMSAYMAWKRQSSVFDLILPTFNVLWGYLLALAVVKDAGYPQVLLGCAGLLFALIHLVFATYLFRQNEKMASVSFTVAGLIVFMLASPLALGNILPALLLWSILAFVLGRFAQSVQAGNFRVLSYLLQVSACLTGLISGDFLPSASQPFLTLTVTGIIAGLSGWQFLWCRRKQGSDVVELQEGRQGGDRSAVLLLATSLISGFFTLHLLAFQIVGIFSADPVNTLKGVQSVIINTGAIFLLFMAMPSRNKEILWIAVVVIIIGAFKVFGYDLFKTSGIPLVLSVLSFGAVAAVGSVLLSRWSRTG